MATCVAAAPASAQVYVEAHGGLNITEDVRVRMRTNTLTAKVDDGYLIGGAIGYDTGPVRIELEASHARASVSSIRETAFGRSYNAVQIGTDSDQRRQSLMLNALVDVPLSSAVTLYGGGGAGVTRMFMRARSEDACDEPIALRATRGETEFRDGDVGNCVYQGRNRSYGFTWQAIAGLDFRMGRGWSIGPSFRYTAATNIRTAAKSMPTGETRFLEKDTYASSNVLVTLTKRFQ